MFCIWETIEMGENFAVNIWGMKEYENYSSWSMLKRVDIQYLSFRLFGIDASGRLLFITWPGGSRLRAVDIRDMVFGAYCFFNRGWLLLSYCQISKKVCCCDKSEYPSFLFNLRLHRITTILLNQTDKTLDGRKLEWRMVEVFTFISW
ncbi:hypothetical protein RND81_03G019400 [Saponaria officinalis]|uniref:F-box associated domain-containing protein n=1 Tax=Saponaria officinalis TaxID=3572 RepID=A0AAW1M4N3_SAPOF